MVCNGKTNCPSEKGLLGSLCQINPLGGIWMRLFDILFSPFFSVPTLVKLYAVPFFTSIHLQHLNVTVPTPFGGNFPANSIFDHSLTIPGTVYEAFSHWPHTNAGSCFSTNTYTHLNRYCTSVCICN